MTDEDDCSTSTPTALKGAQPLGAADSELDDLLCHDDAAALFELDRYVDAFRKLRPDPDTQVFFAVVAGVPPDLVSAEAQNSVDFRDPIERDTYYQGILDDQRMQTVADPGLVPSCVLDNDADGKLDSRAYPPRRLVETVRRFGPNGMLASICASDFTAVLDSVSGLNLR